MRLGQTSAIYSLSQFLGAVFGFLATVYFARVLGDEVLGQYALVLAIVAWLGIGGKIGFTKAIKKRISEGKEPEAFAGAGIIVMGSMVVVAATLVVLLREQVNSYVGVPIAEFIVLLLLAELYKSFMSAALQGNHLVHIYAVLSVLKQGTRALIQVALVALVGLGLTGMLWGYVFSYFLLGTIGLLILGLRPTLPKKRHIVSLFDFAKYSWLGSVESKSFENTDIIVLGLFVSQGLVGIYMVAWSIVKFLEIFGKAISKTLFPELSKLSAEGDADTIARLTEESLTYAGLVLVPGLIGGLVVGDRLMAIYDDPFVIGTNILWILITAMLIYTYNKQLLNTLNAIDRPDLAFRSNGVFILTNIVLNIVLVYHYGWIGAAVATVLSAAIGLGISFHYLNRLVSFRVPVSELGIQWMAAAFMGAVVYAVRQSTETHWIATYNEIYVIGLVSLGALIYFGVLFAVSSRFRGTVLNNLPVELPFVPN